MAFLGAILLPWALAEPITGPITGPEVMTIPDRLYRFLDPGQIETLDRLKRDAEVAEQSEPVEYVVAWRRSDARVLACRAVTEEDRGAIDAWSSWLDPRDPAADRDWLAFAGLGAGA